MRDERDGEDVGDYEELEGILGARFGKGEQGGDVGVCLEEGEVEF